MTDDTPIVNPPAQRTVGELAALLANLPDDATVFLRVRDEYLERSVLVAAVGFDAFYAHGEFTSATIYAEGCDD